MLINTQGSSYRPPNRAALSLSRCATNPVLIFDESFHQPASLFKAFEAGRTKAACDIIVLCQRWMRSVRCDV